MTDVPAAAPESDTGEWPPDGLERLDACPVCGSRSTSELHRGVTDRIHRCAPGTWTLRRCDGCGSALLDPRPTLETMHLAYRAYHTHVPVSTEDARPGGLRRRLFNGYVDAHYGYALKPANRAGRALIGAVPGARGKVSHMMRHLMAPPAGGGRLLDIGCGNGEFLARFAETGWALEGLEPDVDAVAFARRAGLTVHQGLLDDTALRLGTFDALTMSHVIEHLHDPIAGLRVCFQLLRPGGTLWVATPNIASSGHRAFGPDWYALEVPRHLVIFTAPSLRLALRRAGFEIAPRPPVMPIAGLWMYRASAAIASGADPQGEQPPLDRRTALAARVADVKALLRPDTTEELVVVARRPETR